MKLNLKNTMTYFFFYKSIILGLKSAVHSQFKESSVYWWGETYLRVRSLYMIGRDGRHRDRSSPCYYGAMPKAGMKAVRAGKIVTHTHSPAITDLTRLSNPHVCLPTMDPGSHKPTQRISDVARSCLDLFNDCLSKDGDAFARLEGEERRFRAWSNSLKVFAKQHVNLDAQLRLDKHTQIRKMVLLLLNVLKDNLSLGMDVPLSLSSPV